MDKKLSLGTKVAYGSGAFGNSLIFGVMTIYLMVFYTDHCGISAAAVGTLFLVARILDAVFDPIVGMLVDNTRSRWGQFRPYLLFAPFIMAPCTILCFMSPDFSQTGKLIFAYVTYILWGMSFALMDIPYWSMSATLTEDPKERNSVVMIPRTLGTLGWALIGMITLPLVAFFGRGDDRQGFFLTAVLLAVMSIILTLLTYAYCRENVHVEKKKRQTIKDAWTMIVQNRPWRLIICGLLLIDIVYSIKNVFPVYYIIYVLNAKALIPVFMGLNMVVSVAGCMLSSFFCNKFGKTRVAIWGFLLASVSGIIFYFCGYGSPVVLFVFNTIALFTTCVANLAIMSMLMDTVEYGEWKTGRRSEGVIFSANIFRAKVAGAVGGAIGAYGLAMVKYVPNAQQTSSTIQGMHLIFTLIPAALSLVALIPFFLYDLTEEKYEGILKDLVARRGGGAEG